MNGWKRVGLILIGIATVICGIGGILYTSTEVPAYAGSLEANRKEFLANGFWENTEPFLKAIEVDPAENAAPAIEKHFQNQDTVRLLTQIETTQLVGNPPTKPSSASGWLSKDIKRNSTRENSLIEISQDPRVDAPEIVVLIDAIKDQRTKKFCLFPHNYKVRFASVSFPEFTYFRQIFLIILGKSRVAFLKGNIAECVDYLKLAKTIIDWQDDGKTAIATLVQTGFQDKWDETIKTLLVTGWKNEELLNYLDTAWIESDPPDVESILKSTALVDLTFNREVFHGDFARAQKDIGMGHLSPEILRNIKIAKSIPKMDAAVESKVMLAFNTLWKNRPKNDQDFSGWMPAIEKFESTRLKEDFIARMLIPLYFEHSMLRFSLSSLDSINLRSNVRRQALAAARFRLANGKFPTTLPLKGTLSLDKVGGKPLRMTTGNTFQVWTIGANRIDNNGASDFGKSTGRDDFAVVLR